MAAKKASQSPTPSATGSTSPKGPERSRGPATKGRPKKTATAKQQTPRGAKVPQEAPTAATVPPAPTAAAPVAPQAQKLSALDAAAQLLAQTGQAMTCPAMIQALAAQGTWTSPRGKTPAATLYAGILREIQTKGANARFQKTDRGQFAHA